MSRKNAIVADLEREIDHNAAEIIRLQQANRDNEQRLAKYRKLVARKPAKAGKPRIATCVNEDPAVDAEARA